MQSTLRNVGARARARPDGALANQELDLPLQHVEHFTLVLMQVRGRSALRWGALLRNGKRPSVSSLPTFTVIKSPTSHTDSLLPWETSAPLSLCDVGSAPWLKSSLTEKMVAHDEASHNGQRVIYPSA